MNTNLTTAQITAIATEAAVAAVTAMLTGDTVVAPAKTPAKGRTTRKAPAKGRTTRKPAAKAPAKGEIAWNGRKADKKRWNDTTSALAKLSGLRTKKGVSLYRHMLTNWSDVQEAREAGRTPNEALAALKATAKFV